MSALAALAGALALAAVAPLAEAVKLPPSGGDRARAEARGTGAALACRDGITWRRRDLGPRDGPCALLVHGLTTPSPVYDAIAARMAAAGWRAVSYDLYGRGLSGRVRGRYDGALYRRQMEDVLAAMEVQGPVLLVGYSMGGILVTDFAAAFPQRVSGVGLLAPGGMGHAPDPLSRVCRDVPGLGDWLMRMVGPSSLRKVAQAASQGPSDVPGIGAVMAAETRKRGYMPAVLSSLRHVLTADQSAQHRSVAQAGIPTLAIWGARDSVIPLWAADRLHAAHPEARRLEVAGAEHGLPFTHADAVSAALLDQFGRPG